MKNCSSIKAVLSIGTIVLLFSSIVVPITIGNNVRISNSRVLAEKLKFGKYNLPEFLECYNIDEIPDSEKYNFREHLDNDNIRPETVIDPDSSPQILDGSSMDSPWPMYCHDVRHTGRSPYSTADNSGLEKWRFRTELSGIFSGIVISDDGTIYFSGSYDFFAVYPNSTLKWRYDTGGTIESCPAIDENGVIYVGTAFNTVSGNRLYAFYPNGTVKWTYFTGDHIFSSPAIADDGTIYFGCYDHNIYAVYPDGTLKWKFPTANAVLSSPAIGDDGTIYCGSHDYHLYALYPNNGTMKWKFPTGYYVRVSPCIADDGTIYCVSRDGYLYAVYPNGVLKWKTNVHAGTSPTIGQDGTIYAGWEKLYAIDPTNGSIKWTFDVEGKIQSATPCNSIDGTIYLGNYDGSDIVAVNPDGTEKWRKSIGGDVESAPAIGEDGTIYIGSQLTNDGYLHAFGSNGSDAPSAPDIDGPNRGNPGIDYNFTFVSTDPDNQRIKYYVDWGDGNTIETDYHKSGEVVILNHTWNARKTYTIKATAEDSYGEQSNESSFKITILRNKVVNFNINLLSWFLVRFPLLERLFPLFK